MAASSSDQLVRRSLCLNVRLGRFPRLSRPGLQCFSLRRSATINGSRARGRVTHSEEPLQHSTSITPISGPHLRVPDLYAELTNQQAGAGRRPGPASPAPPLSKKISAGQFRTLAIISALTVHLGRPLSRRVLEGNQTILGHWNYGAHDTDQAQLLESGRISGSLACTACCRNEWPSRTTP